MVGKVLGLQNIRSVPPFLTTPSVSAARYQICFPIFSQVSSHGQTLGKADLSTSCGTGVLVVNLLYQPPFAYPSIPMSTSTPFLLHASLPLGWTTQPGWSQRFFVMCLHREEWEQGPGCTHPTWAPSPIYIKREGAKTDDPVAWGARFKT